MKNGSTSAFISVLLPGSLTGLNMQARVLEALVLLLQEGYQ